ncbi:MAG: hypothetical protein K8S25_01320, partial [Alphaproteobacteria bacterium]|nr:hypothetical protein [Alphaproteobacteria bacterium]
PKSDACEWKRAYYSKREWLVRSDGERLVIEPIVDGVRSKTRKTPVPVFDIRPTEDPRGPPCDDCILRVDDGWLVGFNFGEWVGRLWWTDPEGHNAYHVADPGKNCDGTPTQPSTRLYEHTITNIVSLQRTGERALAFSGLNHLGWSFGEISRVERRDGKWQTCRLRDLGSVPYAVIADGPQWLVLAESGLARFDAGGTIQHLGRFAFLEPGLYPNSMVKMPDGTIFVGIRHFVARLLPEHGKYRDQLLLPADKPQFEYDEWLDGKDGILAKECKRLK